MVRLSLSGTVLWRPCLRLYGLNRVDTKILSLRIFFGLLQQIIYIALYFQNAVLHLDGPNHVLFCLLVLL